jgi:hypothetical protein
MGTIFNHGGRTMNAITELKSHLAGLGNGPISDSTEVERHLVASWHLLNRSNEGGMEGHKLHGRMEDVTWNPPVLKFVVERHGGTMLGSTRAKLQHWEVNLDAGTAEITKTGHRQLEPMAPRISIKGIADEIAQAILNSDDDKRFFIDSHNGDLVVNASSMFPTGSGFKRTVEGRRMRLCNYIADILADNGWQKVGWDRFCKDTR